ncbi:hypothetical protein [Chitinophaga sp. XS-30]|uniref:hypothetical protein n=1 Tax=Chitinophaga sp. XS-30 TaxID=2604421 RepID=UPI0011DE4837|nr:hypothetical protein [Chitinophaga sp. XS-30]QEH39420.1 hypothetical protein FW415_00445 [Chitinophaga sp. XS-30]
MEHVSTAWTIRNRNQQASGRSSTSGASTVQRTTAVSERGFLNYRFPSLWVGSGSLFNIQTTQKTFVRSLDYFCEAWGINRIHLSALPYPRNIAETFRCAETEANARGIELRLVKQRGKPLTLVSRKYFDPYCNHLFFIPLQPIQQLMESGRKAAANLLLSIARHLYHAGVPHYEGGTIIGEMHDYMENSLREMDDPEEIDQVIGELKQIETQGKQLLTRLRSKINRTDFAFRIEQGLPGDPAEAAIMEVAQQAFTMHQQYPGKRIKVASSKADIRSYLEYGDTDELESNMVYWERYVSFCWSLSGKLFDYGKGYIEAVLQEYSVQEYPYAECMHNKPTPELSINLEFEKQFFELADDFAYLLNSVL